MPRKPQIRRVWIENRVDEYPDLEHLGRYSQTDGHGAIDRHARGDMKRNEYRYWIPSGNHKPSSWGHVSDRGICRALDALPDWQSRDTAKRIGYPARFDRFRAIAYLEACYNEQDYRRLESYGSDWHQIGLVAKAEVTLAESDTVQALQSSGIWGVESDCDSHIAAVSQEQLSDLRYELMAVGCTARQVDHAFSNVIVRR